MDLINTHKIREQIARQRSRGNTALKVGRVISVEEREKRNQRAEKTPYLDEMMARL